MKSYLITSLATLFFILSASAQDEAQHINVLDAPEGWGLEVIPFPLGFARSIDYVGVEEVWFAPGWSDIDSEGFWAYAFVWYLDADAELTSEKLEKHMEAYYDGLMGVDDSKALFIKLNDDSFAGVMRTFDRFSTKKEITLYATMEPSFCEKTDKHAYVFRIAPNSYDDQAWMKLSEVKLSKNCTER